LRQYRPSPPSLSLRIKGFRAPRSDEGLGPVGSDQSTLKEQERFQILNFTVPLPSPSKSTGGILFARSDDVPCFRGRKVDPGWKMMPLGESGYWGSTSLNGQIYDSISRHPFQASSLTKEKWNSKVDRLMEPWLKLDERGSANGMLNEEVKQKAERTLSSNLKRILNFKSRTKWLLCRQTVYGWDLPLVLNQIRELVQDETSGKTGDAQVASISHITISIDPPPLFIALKLFSSLAMFSSSIMGSADLVLLGIIFGCTAFWVIIIILGVCGGSCGPNQNSILPWSSWSFWLFNMLVVSFYVLSYFARDTNQLFDAVGLAWPLKIYDTRDDRNGHNKMGFKELVSGVEEVEWVEKHKDLLRSAIKARRTGDLRSEWPDEFSCT